MSQDPPKAHRVRARDVELAVFEWGGRHERPPTLLLLHATGFHARCWDPVIRRLGKRHAIAIDQRGHGRSEKTEIHHWDVFGQDVASVVREMGLRDVIGVGHSMGGHALVDAAAALPERFRRLVLIDPVIGSPDVYGEGGWAVAKLAGRPHPTARRKSRFSSSEEMIERFRHRVPYRVFHPEALRAYCTYGLLPAEDGAGCVLACPPAIEASIYMTSATNKGVHDSIRALDLPVLVLRAKRPPDERDVMDFSSSPTWPALAACFRRGREIHFTDRTHFLPMEVPEQIAALIAEEACREPGEA